jgi:Na+/H+ antiporter NhaD/arsenite permease-like protein
MDWYHIFNTDVERWVTLALFVVTFALILYRRFNIAYISLIAAFLFIMLGITSPGQAFLKGVNWDVLALYWGYGMLVTGFLESNIPRWLANRILSRLKKEKYALLFLCILAMVLSSFMVNPVVVIMLAPLAIEIATRLKASLFLYLVALSVSSNVVTTVTMISDPPAIILATSTGMGFLDFYWFQSRIGLGTLSIIGIGVALSTLLFQFRKLNNRVEIKKEEDIKVTYAPLALFITSVLALAFIPWKSLGAWNHPGLVGFVLGILSLAIERRQARHILRELDWNSILFLVGIFIVIDTVNNIGLLSDFTAWLGATGLKSPTLYLAIFVWVSVALSSFIDNVPYTVLMIPVCAGVAQVLGVSPFPFYFGMLVGTGIGGNITPVGATANVLASGMLEKRGYKVTLGRFMAISVPFSVSAVLAVHVLLQLFWL